MNKITTANDDGVVMLDSNMTKLITPKGKKPSEKEIRDYADSVWSLKNYNESIDEDILQLQTIKAELDKEALKLKKRGFQKMYYMDSNGTTRCASKEVESLIDWLEDFTTRTLV